MKSKLLLAGKKLLDLVQLYISSEPNKYLSILVPLRSSPGCLGPKKIPSLRGNLGCFETMFLVAYYGICV